MDVNNQTQNYTWLKISFTLENLNKIKPIFRKIFLQDLPEKNPIFTTKFLCFLVKKSNTTLKISCTLFLKFQLSTVSVRPNSMLRVLVAAFKAYPEVFVSNLVVHPINRDNAATSYNQLIKKGYSHHFPPVFVNDILSEHILHTKTQQELIKAFYLLTTAEPFLLETQEIIKILRRSMN